MNTTTKRTSPIHGAGWSLYSSDGRRKYLNRSELDRFLKAAALEDRAVHTLCLTLAYTGCRISEALSLTVSDIQLEADTVSIRTLKQRGRLAVREIPIPHRVTRLLVAGREGDAPDALLWAHGRTLAWQHIKRVMDRAGIAGPHASPHGLRHCFGVSAVQSGVPLSLLQKWLGHANIATTAIYADVTGPEERQLARRMWDGMTARINWSRLMPFAGTHRFAPL